MKDNKKKNNTKAASQQDEAEPSGSSDTFSLDEIARLTNDPELVKRIKELKADQDGELPDLNHGQDSYDRSYVKELRNDDKYRMEQALAEAAQIEKASQVTSESKNFLSEMDDFLKDLEGWKKQRMTQQDAVGGAQAASTEETKAEELGPDFNSNDELRKLEEEFMRKTNEREQQILAQLKALNIDPEKATGKAQVASAAPTDEEKSAEILAKIEELNEREKRLDKQVLPSGQTYEELMKEIEEKEALLKQKEDEFRREAYEEIKLSENNQAKVDGRKKELEAVLANMQALESEFDELDESYDAKLFALLQQAAPGGSQPPPLKAAKK